MDEEQTQRIAKLQAETEVLKLQAEKERKEISQLTREEATALVISQRLSQRYWFIPSGTRIYQSIGAGLLFAGAFFFLFQPVMQTVREVTEKESKLAALEADIQKQENNKLALINKEAEGRIERERERLRDENERIKNEYESFISAIQAAEMRAQKDAATARNELAKLHAEADSDQNEIQQLQLDLQRSEEAANQAASQSELLQTSLDTRLIAGLNIDVLFIDGNRGLVKLLQAPLNKAGAKVTLLEVARHTILVPPKNYILFCDPGSEVATLGQVEALLSDIVDPLEVLEITTCFFDLDIMIYLFEV